MVRPLSKDHREICRNEGEAMAYAIIKNKACEQVSHDGCGRF